MGTIDCISWNWLDFFGATDKIVFAITFKFFYNMPANYVHTYIL